MISSVFFNKLITDSTDVCCLCLNESVDSIVQFHDEDLIRNECSTDTGVYFEAFKSLFSEEIMDYLSCIKRICTTCAEELLKSYNFIIQVKQNILHIIQSIETMYDSLNHLNIFENKFKTLFIDLKRNQEYYDTKAYGNNKSKAFKKLLSIKQNSVLPAINNECKDLNTHGKKSVQKNNKSQCAEKPHKCSYCTRCFETADLLQEHRQQSHCKVPCEKCGKLYENKKILRQHEKTHNQILICDQCGRVYKTIIAFKQHIDSRSCIQNSWALIDQGTFICDYCGKSYTQKMSLRVHIQYEHLNYKGHKCEFCNKKFWAQSKLKIHLTKHTKEKNYPCPICGGKYATRDSLLIHTRLHTGDKPYKCRKCGEGFVSSSRKLAHYRKMHLKETFPCNDCHIIFPSKYRLMKHIHNKHLGIKIS